MPRTFLSVSRPARRWSSFTLVELLTVIVIIGILAALTVAAAFGVLKTASRSRARTEIAAISSALENYKTDNGTYPPSTGFGSTNAYIQASPVSPNGTYQLSSQLLYQSLTGQTNFGDAPPAPQSETKVYMTFTKSQLGNNTAGAGNPIYIQDPFGNSYGYFTGVAASGTPPTVAAPPNNGAGFFDLWSSGGDTTGVTNSWINNWNGN